MIVMENGIFIGNYHLPYAMPPHGAAEKRRAASGHGVAWPGVAWHSPRAVIRLRGRRGSPGLAACRRRKHKRACTRPGHDLNNFFFFATKQFARDS